MKECIVRKIDKNDYIVLEKTTFEKVLINQYFLSLGKPFCKVSTEYCDGINHIDLAVSLEEGFVVDFLFFDKVETIEFKVK